MDGRTLADANPTMLWSFDCDTQGILPFIRTTTRIDPHVYDQSENNTIQITMNIVNALDITSCLYCSGVEFVPEFSSPCMNAASVY